MSRLGHNATAEELRLRAEVDLLKREVARLAEDFTPRLVRKCAECRQPLDIAVWVESAADFERGVYCSYRCSSGGPDA